MKFVFWDVHEGGKDIGKTMFLPKKINKLRNGNLFRPVFWIDCTFNMSKLEAQLTLDF
jgi:hypothetical protein